MNINRGGTIRTISVSLLAVAAIVAGVLLSRSSREAPPVAEHPGQERDKAAAISLEDLRRAGI